jgi:hypothetical protein
VKRCECFYNLQGSTPTPHGYRPKPSAYKAFLSAFISIFWIIFTLQAQANAPQPPDPVDEISRIESRLAGIAGHGRPLADIRFNAGKYYEANIGDIIDLNASAIDDLGEPVTFNYQCNIKGSPRLIEQIGRTDSFRVTAPGWAELTVEAEGFVHTAFYFVFPVPSKNCTRGDEYWYKTQFDTGLKSNCGPASASMAIHWASGRDIPVREIRDYIGLPYANGGITYTQITAVMDHFNVNYRTRRIFTLEDMFDAIDRNHIMIILFDQGGIEIAKGDAGNDLFGRYYADRGGHFVVIKGYSLDKRNFIVNDPMPSDWTRNDFRHSDGISMIGRNRYYSADNLYRQMIGDKIIEILGQ